MRAITRITVQKDSKRVTMFLSYNNNDNDYSFNNFETIEEAIESLPKGDSYFPLVAKGYRLLDFSSECKDIMPVTEVEF